MELKEFGGAEFFLGSGRKVRVIFRDSEFSLKEFILLAKKDDDVMRMVAHLQKEAKKRGMELNQFLLNYFGEYNYRFDITVRDGGQVQFDPDEYSESKIVKIRFLKIGKDKYDMSYDGVHKDIIMGPEELRKYLRKISAADVDTLPRSKRFSSYKSMANNISQGVCPHVFAPIHKLKESTLMSKIEEVASVIKALAKKTKKSEKEVEKMWKEAIKIAEDTFGKKEKDFKDKEFAYTTGILKNMLGIKESNEIVKQFIDSGKTAKEFISNEETQSSDSMGIDKTIVDKDKKKKVVDPVEKEEGKFKEIDLEQKEKSSTYEIARLADHMTEVIKDSGDPASAAKNIIDALMSAVSETDFYSSPEFGNSLKSELNKYQF